MIFVAINESNPKNFLAQINFPRHTRVKILLMCTEIEKKKKKETIKNQRGIN